MAFLRCIVQFQQPVWPRYIVIYILFILISGCVSTDGAFDIGSEEESSTEQMVEEGLDEGLTFNLLQNEHKVVGGNVSNRRSSEITSSAEHTITSDQQDGSLSNGNTAATQRSPASASTALAFGIASGNSQDPQAHQLKILAATNNRGTRSIFAHSQSKPLTGIQSSTQTNSQSELNRNIFAGLFQNRQSMTLDPSAPSDPDMMGDNPNNSNPTDGKAAFQAPAEQTLPPLPAAKSMPPTQSSPSAFSTAFVDQSRAKQDPAAKITHLQTASILPSDGTSIPQPKLSKTQAKDGIFASLFKSKPTFDEPEFKTDPIEMASLSGLAQLSPLALERQTDTVDVTCLKPKLVRLLKKVEEHYQSRLIVTSGYRSNRENRRIGGAAGSLHTKCEAADIQVEGVSKWALAKYVRNLPDRGGVGTYCHTKSVHIDIGPSRDWNWRCRKREK